MNAHDETNRTAAAQRRASRPRMRLAGALCFVAALVAAPPALAETILFVGNSFTYGGHSAAWRYRADTVHDLNGDGVGGVPALFKLFTVQAGLDYDVSLETQGGKDLKFHYTERRDRLDRAWDHVVLQELSTLNRKKPGDPTNFREYAPRLAALFTERNPDVEIMLMATWSRPDQTYVPKGHWYGRPIDAMADDLEAAYRQVDRSSDLIDGVVPVGGAFSRAIAAGVADGNPYDGIAYGQVDLWAYDHYHASVWGSYLEALMLFGSITGRDPRSLGKDEQAASELGISSDQAVALQTIAYEQLRAEGR